jgi:hypothetical protein
VREIERRTCREVSSINVESSGEIGTGVVKSDWWSKTANSAKDEGRRGHALFDWYKDQKKETSRRAIIRLTNRLHHPTKRGPGSTSGFLGKVSSLNILTK